MHLLDVCTHLLQPFWILTQMENLNKHILRLSFTFPNCAPGQCSKFRKLGECIVSETGPQVFIKWWKTKFLSCNSFVFCHGCNHARQDLGPTLLSSRTFLVPARLLPVRCVYWSLGRTDFGDVTDTNGKVHPCEVIKISPRVNGARGEKEWGQEAGQGSTAVLRRNFLPPPSTPRPHLHPFTFSSECDMWGRWVDGSLHSLTHCLLFHTQSSTRSSKSKAKNTRFHTGWNKPELGSTNTNPSSQKRQEDCRGKHAPGHSWPSHFLQDKKNRRDCS